jgi:HAMP domain-containing protein
MLPPIPARNPVNELENEVRELRKQLEELKKVNTKIAALHAA